MFVFSGSQRRGTIVLVSFTCIFGLYYYFNALIPKQDLAPLVFDSIITSSQSVSIKEQKQVKSINIKSSDPNTWVFADWNQFGLSNNQIKTINKYKNSLGGFSSFEQIKKCHVISLEKFKAIKKFIVFKKPNKTKLNPLSSFTLIFIDSIPNYELNNVFDSLYFKKNNDKYHYYVDSDLNLASMSKSENLNYNIQNLGTFMINKKELYLLNSITVPLKTTPFNINQADVAELSAISGIGKVFSNRIIQYRNLLGGFVSSSQFEEIYGLKEEVYSQLANSVFIDLESIETINLNEVSLDELKQHPYFNWTLSNAIVNYRYHHGDFKSKSNIKKIHLVNDEIYRKIAPYISVS